MVAGTKGVMELVTVGIAEEVIEGIPEKVVEDVKAVVPKGVVEKVVDERLFTCEMMGNKVREPNYSFLEKR